MTDWFECWVDVELVCSDTRVDPFHVGGRPSKSGDVIPEKRNDLAFRVVGKVGADSDDLGLVTVVDGYLENLFLERVYLLDWFGD